MNKHMNNDSIRLFKRHRETDEIFQELLTKDAPDTEKNFSDLVITPLENKKKEISSQPKAQETTAILPNLMQKGLTSLGIVSKNNSEHASLGEHITRTLPSWLSRILR